MGAVEESDRVVWPWSSDGLYSIKSGYHFLRSREHNDSSMGQSSHMIPDLVWKLIWNLKTLPKIKLFCWRVLNKAVATRLELYKKHCASSPLCPICEQAEESIEHTLFLCPWTHTVWFGSPLSYRVDSQGFTTSDVWFQNMSRDLPRGEKERILTILSFFLWEIWKTWCKVIFEGQKIDPLKVINNANKAAYEYQAATVKIVGQSSVRNNGLAPWCPPRSGFIKVNVDGAWKDAASSACFGVILRDSSGAFCGGTAGPNLCESALMSKAEAALSGLKLAAQFGH
ncbi:unnamed protein product [Prunus armeniaca]